MTVEGTSRAESRHTGKHTVFIQYLGVCETLPAVLSKILNQVQNDGQGGLHVQNQNHVILENTLCLSSILEFTKPYQQCFLRF
ncbi:hypothetical protein BCS96_07465 [Vibrio breoganii]|nr:hypothetical protein BCU81_11740 [Vibrio breoganii]PML84325.1 hypothetical protein BCT68_08855 [Vibrio breoganii]PMP00334.1 hypothetical protein BCS96_07465 [Vibrio breoganii]